MTTLETVPDRWDTDRDEPFFRRTVGLLPAAFVAAASVLLASYDDEPTPTPSGARPEQPSVGRPVPAQAAVPGSGG